MKNIFFKKYIVFTAFIIISCLASCAKLDMSSDGRLTLDDIFSRYNTTKNYYSACYTFMPKVGFNYQDGKTPLASFSDEAHDASDGVAGNTNDWYNNRTSPTNNPVEGQYSWGYYFQGIRKCNTFLTSIDDPNVATAAIDPIEKNGWIAEVRVLRAFYYLQLIKRFGGVPIINTPYEVTHDFGQDKRATFEECVDFILADCDAALAIPETEVTSSTGFRWEISDAERGTITRAFAYAVKSQAALYAASPLWYSGGSKYTWERVTEITKGALDQCLAHGFQLFDTKPAADVAQNAYGYYFIFRSDPSRSVDKETIFETTAGRTNVWKWAGTPIITGAEKAGAGPSQELVDAYGMQATGEMPILGYSDGSHLQPIVNATSGYNPNAPYEGRDPRFYTSIYYNNSPRSLTSGIVEKDEFPLRFTTVVNGITVQENAGEYNLKTTNTDPWIHTTPLGGVLPNGEKRVFTFEYKSNKRVTNAEIFFAVAGGPEGGKSLNNIVIEQASGWTRYEYNLSTAISNWGFGVNSNGGQPPANHFLRFDLTTVPDYEISIRNMKIEVFTNPPVPTPVETFVGGNSGISNNITETRFTRTGYYLRKFNNYKSGVNVDGDGLMKIFRLGELYLNFAEAASNAVGADALVEGKANGATALSAREAINLIRARAEMPALPAGLSKENFQTRYRNERQVELAFEEHRFFDVRRWKILAETDKFVTGMRITRNSNNYTYNRIKLQDRGTGDNKYLLQPINQSEAAKMQSFTGQVWQNAGW